MQKYTIQRLHETFPDEAACLEWLKDKRWPDGITCKKCQRVTNHYKVASRRSYECEFCGNHIHPTAGTIYHKSVTPLRSWFYAVYLMAQTRTGISAKQLQREIGVTYKTAWRMFTRIRKMMAEDIDPFTGQVEADETYIGGRRPGKRGRGAAHKAIVGGVVERHGKISAEVIPNVKAVTLIPMIETKILPSATIFTDELKSYDGLSKRGYAHERVHHAAQVYVDGTAHVNTIESFWSNTKRGLDGVHHSVGHHKLQGYLDSYTYRWNHRDDEQPMFITLLSRVASEMGTATR